MSCIEQQITTSLMNDVKTLDEVRAAAKATTPDFCRDVSLRAECYQSAYLGGAYWSLHYRYEQLAKEHAALRARTGVEDSAADDVEAIAEAHEAVLAR